MTCTELQAILPDMMEGEAAGEAATHLRSCPACSSLVSDLKAICEQARQLGSIAEPSPRVWANIQRALEAEGLVRTPRQAGGVLVPAKGRWSAAAWLVPVAAALLLGAGLLLYSNRLSGPAPRAESRPSNPPLLQAANPSNAVADADDQQLLAQVAPPMRAVYEDNLKNVNAFIQDAQQTLAQNPEDDDARHFLMDAYEQKAMVYELAMNRAMQ